MLVGTCPSEAMLPTPRQGVDKLLASKENRVIRVQGGIVDSRLSIYNTYGTPQVYLLDDEAGTPFTPSITTLRNN